MPELSIIFLRFAVSKPVQPQASKVSEAIPVKVLQQNAPSTRHLKVIKSLIDAAQLYCRFTPNLSSD
jgi:hypothetical protein